MTAKAGKAGADEAPANGSRAADSAARPLGNGAAGISSAAEPVLAELAEDLLCPICMSQLRDPFVTSCGHSFCHACVSKHLAHRNNCPSCAAYLTVDGIFPNFLLQKVVSKASGAQARRRTSPLEALQHLLSDGADADGALALKDVNELLQLLWERKQVLEQQQAEANLELLLHFLQHSRKDKARKLQQLQAELLTLEDDISAVAGRKALASQLEDAALSAAAEDGAEPGSDGYPAVLAGLPAPRLPSELLQMRIHGVAEENGDHQPGSPQSGMRGALSDGTNVTMSDQSLPSTAGPARPHAVVPPLPGASSEGPQPSASGAVGDASREAASALPPADSLELQSTLQPTNPGWTEDPDRPAGEGGGTAPGPKSSASEPAIADSARAKRNKRVVSQFEDLQQCYLQLRHRPRDKDGEQQPDAVPAGEPSAADDDRMPKRQRVDSHDAQATAAAAGSPAAWSAGEGLNEFVRMLSVFTHCSRLRVLAQLPQASTRQSSAILSSIEFDRDAQFFATAGVSKRISIYDFAAVLANPYSDVHCPALELGTRSKLSCLSWHRYIKSNLISSDYEGVVALWDVNTSQPVTEYEAHEKRIWSVDFCHTDPMLFLSGSDDGWVKVWSTKEQSSVVQLDMKANVCSVKYSPASAHQLAIGSADHFVHLYDLRMPSEPLHMFSGHRKAVSYVRYLNDNELVSASTDSTLRLWNIEQHAMTRLFEGHLNEKNFVGLSADGEFIACGSELNEVYVYYKMMSKPIAKRVFSAAAHDPVGTLGHGQDGTQFISSLCWKPGTNTLLAANSQGTIKLLQLAS